MLHNQAHTERQYARFQTVYDHLNRELFGNTLPDCLITLNRKAKTYGYFSGDRFASLVYDGEKT